MVNELNFLKIPSQKQMIEAMELYKGNKPEIQRPLDFSIVNTIKKVANPLKKYIEDIDTNSNPNDDIIVAGSGAAWAQINTFRKPHDIDLEVSQQYIESVKNHIIKILRKKYKNITVRQLTIGSEGIKVTQILVNNRPVVDIKPHKQVGSLIYVHYGDLYTEIRTRTPIKIGKIYYTHINELFERKVKSILENYYDAKKQGKPINPRLKKDVKDYEKIKKSLSKTKKDKINTKIDMGNFMGLSNFFG